MILFAVISFNAICTKKQKLLLSVQTHLPHRSTTLDFELDPEISISSLKELIHRMIGVPPQHQHLYTQANFQLFDLLHENGIDKNKIISLSTDEPTQDGPKATCQFGDEAERPLPETHYKTRSETEQNEATLREEQNPGNRQTPDKDKPEVLRCGKQKLQVFVRNPLLHGPKTLCFHLHSETLVSTLKESVYRKIGIQPQHQLLHIKRNVLNFQLHDLLTLNECGIQQDENISLCLPARGLLGGGRKDPKDLAMQHTDKPKNDGIADTAAESQQRGQQSCKSEAQDSPVKMMETSQGVSSSQQKERTQGQDSQQGSIETARSRQGEIGHLKEPQSQEEQIEEVTDISIPLPSAASAKHWGQSGDLTESSDQHRPLTEKQQQFDEVTDLKYKERTLMPAVPQLWPNDRQLIRTKVQSPQLCQGSDPDSHQKHATVSHKLLQKPGQEQIEDVLKSKPEERGDMRIPQHYQTEHTCMRHEEPGDPHRQKQQLVGPRDVIPAVQPRQEGTTNSDPSSQALASQRYTHPLSEIQKCVAWQQVSGDLAVGGSNNPTFLGPVHNPTIQFTQHVTLPRPSSDGQVEQVKSGSITFVVRILSRVGLEKLWDMYTTGELSKKLSEIFITDELTKEDKSDLSILVTILESDYEQACRFFEELESAGHEGDDKDTRTKTEVQKNQLGGVQSSLVMRADSSDPAEGAADRCEVALKTLYMSTGTFAKVMKWVSGESQKIQMPKPLLEKDGERLLHFEDMFVMTTQDGNPIETAILTGEEGAEMTFLLENIAYEWAAGRSPVLWKFKLVAFLEMGAFQPESDLNVVDTIYEQLLGKDTDVDRGDLVSFVDTNPHKVLVLLDGCDRFMTNDPDESFDETVIESIILKILRWTTARGIHLLMTFFHSNFHNLRRKLLFREPFIRVTVAGVSEEEIEKYVKAFYSKEPGKAENFLRRIQSSELLSDWAKNVKLVPLLCLILKNSGLPETMTRLYDKALKYIFTRHSDMSQDEISQAVIALGKTALSGLVSLEQRFSLGEFPEKEFDEGVLDKALQAGLLTRQPALSLSGQKSNVCSIKFCHPKIQDFCTAKYCQSVADKDIAEFQKILDRISDPGAFEFLLYICCGDNEHCARYIVNMLLMKGYTPMKFVLQTKQEKWRVHEVALNCYFESQSVGLLSVDFIESFMTENMLIQCEKNDSLKSCMWFLEHISKHVSGNDYLARVRSVTVFKCNLSGFGVVLASSLAGMKHLHSLRLYSCTLSGSFLEQVLSSVGRAGNLTKLGIWHSVGVSDDVEKWSASLKTVTHLKSLTLCSCHIEAQDFTHIGRSLVEMTDLAHLDLPNNEKLGGITDVWAFRLHSLRNLEELNLSRCNIDAQDLPNVAKSVGELANLTDLNLSCNMGLGGHADTWAASLKSMTNLKKLVMSYCGIECGDVKYLAEAIGQMEDLMQCRFCGNEVDVVVESSVTCIRVKNKMCSLSSKDMAETLVSLRSRKDLVSLVLHGITGLSGCAVLWTPPLRELTHLEVLVLNDCSLQTTDIQHLGVALSQMRSLQELRLDCGMESLDFKHLAEAVGRAQNLIRCDFSGSKAKLRVMSQDGSIQLNIQECSLTGEDMADVLQSLSSREDLVGLTFEGIPGLCDSGALWTPLLPKLTRLKKLELHVCSLQSTDVKHLAAALSQMPALKYLCLKGNWSLGGAAKIWAPSLKEMIHIVRLNVSRCGLQLDDVEHVAAALGQMPNIKELVWKKIRVRVPVQKRGPLV
ncbi:uncharacterized protein LOC110990087 isoform X2 [Acanthaster planci]|uniref:Uncharacterized protein LOC110990087 isoform X2 n=1 Tax=Acanthaster planci TaxID=133434 RepID=A0A8B8A3W6_ACAPL|nr:uncharacterized protein LOC110990087 isoform X2 [Acanthaster planci]